MSLAQIEAELDSLSVEELRQLAQKSLATLEAKTGSAVDNICDEDDPPITGGPRRGHPFGRCWRTELLSGRGSRSTCANGLQSTFSKRHFFWILMELSARFQKAIQPSRRVLAIRLSPKPSRSAISRRDIRDFGRDHQYAGSSFRNILKSFTESVQKPKL